MEPLPHFFVELAGWIPSVILPTAALLQLVKIMREKKAAGVSVIAWILFGIANICLYIYAEKYSSPQSVIGLLGTAAINFMVVGAVFFFRRRKNDVWRRPEKIQPPVLSRNFLIDLDKTDHNDYFL